jgi:hypothetical protein
MKIKNLTAIGIMVFSLVIPTSLTGCIERTEETVEYENGGTAPVIVPDRGDVDVNVHTDSQPAPNVIHKDTSTNTTIEKDYDSGIKTETKTESTTVH